jgi:outer membrane protein, heavy metal efflux system
MKARTLLTAVTCLSLAALSRADVISEQDAVNRALANELFEQVLVARQGKAESQRAAAGRWHNPEVTYERETLDLPGGESEETTLSITQRFNLAGIKRLERRAAGHDLDAARARTELLRRERVALTRLAFYQALMAEQRAERMRGLITELGALDAAVRARAQAGDVSRYDTIRMQRELAIQDARHLQLQSEARAARQQLQLLADVSITSTLQGKLLPPSLADMAATDRIAGHPLLTALDAEQRSATSQAQASARKLWPDMTLGLGRKSVSEPGLEADGQVISLGLELPLGDSGRKSAAAHHYQASQLRAERESLLQQLRAEESTARETINVNRQASEKLAVHDGQGEMVNIARAAYQAGEISVVELLDAFSSGFSLHENLLQHAMAARQAHIQWQQLTGE